MEKIYDSLTEADYNKLISEYRKEESQSPVAEDPLVRSYNHIIYQTSELAKEFNIKNPFIICYLFEYLCWNGYLSDRKKFIYDEKNVCDFDNCGGLDVVLGNGVCRNISVFLTDLLRKCGTEAYTTDCDLRTMHLSPTFYKPNIKQNFASRPYKKEEAVSARVSMLRQYIGNHADTMFKYNGKFYLSDPTNLLFYGYDRYRKASLYFEGNNKVNLGFFFLSLYYCKDKKELDDIYSSFGSNDFFNSLGVILCGENTVKKCRDNQKLLDEFSSSIKGDIVDIKTRIRR